MQKLKLSAAVNAILGVLALLALIILYLALSDIADGGSDSSLEWYIVGISMIVIGVFAVSSYVTIFFVFKHQKTQIIKN